MWPPVVCPSVLRKHSPFFQAQEEAGPDGQGILGPDAQDVVYLKRTGVNGREASGLTESNRET